MSTSCADRLDWLATQPLPLAENRVYRQWIGGAILDRLQGRPEPRDDHFPEEWVGSTTVSRLAGRPADEGLSRVMLPDGGTVFLRDLIRAFPEAMLGDAHVARFGPELGVLCKILDSAMRLSIQAHPSSAFARRHLGSEFGKTESWIILGTRAIDGVPPHILYGFREGVSEAEFRRATREQDVPALLAALNRIDVHPGQIYLVPAGTPHALGPGVLLVEVQEPTDFVVNAEAVCGEIRRTDSQCFMGLDLDLAMDCFDYAAAGSEFVRRHTLAPRLLRQDADAVEEILIGPAQTPCFGAARLTVRGTAPLHDKGRAHIGIVVGGRGRLTHAGGEIPLAPASTLFVPAACRHAVYRASPGEPLVLLKCFPPVPCWQGPH